MYDRVMTTLYSAQIHFNSVHQLYMYYIKVTILVKSICIEFDLHKVVIINSVILRSFIYRWILC